MKKYDLVYMDPPWKYRDKAEAGNRGAESKYPVMPLKSIMAIPVNELTQDDAILMMWATKPLLREALRLIEAWGFKYVTTAFTWIKLSKDGNPMLNMGAASTRGNAEDVLFATKGNGLRRKHAGISQVVMTKERLEHSAKPEEVRSRIDLLFPEGNRLEMFSRTEAENWDVWGNQAEKSISHPLLNNWYQHFVKPEMSEDKNRYLDVVSDNDYYRDLHLLHAEDFNLRARRVSTPVSLSQKDLIKDMPK